jgi:hypothetical protein
MTVDKNNLRNLYITLLEEDIIKEIAIIKNIDNRIAMEKYYNSKLCQQINSGEYNIEYMDSKYLANDLIENEPELFKISMEDMLGCMRGKFKMANDFDEPLEDFKEYMYTDEELENIKNDIK